MPIAFGEVRRTTDKKKHIVARDYKPERREVATRELQPCYAGVLDEVVTVCTYADECLCYIYMLFLLDPVPSLISNIIRRS